MDPQLKNTSLSNKTLNKYIAIVHMGSIPNTVFQLQSDDTDAMINTDYLDDVISYNLCIHIMHCKWNFPFKLCIFQGKIIQICNFFIF